MTHNFKRLEIWKQSMDLVERVYLTINEVPNDERFGLKSQISRSAVSIPSNIAEGSGRDSEKEFGRFLSISIGSLHELETQLILLNRLYKLDTGTLVDSCQNLQRMISGFKLKILSNTNEGQKT